MPHGLARAYCENNGGCVGTHTPGVVRGRQVSGTFVRSAARSDWTRAATCSPSAMPSVFAAPSAILLRESAYASSIFDFWAGTTWIRMWRAAGTAAASARALGANGPGVTYRG